MNRVLAMVLAGVVALTPATWAAAWGWRRSCGCPAPCIPCLPTSSCPAIVVCEAGPPVSGGVEQPSESTLESQRPATPDDMPDPPIEPPVIEDESAEEPPPPTEDAAPVPDAGRYEPSVTDPGVAAPPFADPEPSVEEEPDSEPDPADEPPRTNPLEGLFDESAAPIDPLADPSFAEPEGAVDAGPAVDSPPAEESAPENDPADEDPESTLDDDLFGISETSPEIAPRPSLSEGEARVWMDPSGQHTCAARLIEMTASGAVLLRDDGVEVHVRYRNLSDMDLSYLRERIHAMRRERFDRDDRVAMGG